MSVIAPSLLSADFTRLDEEMKRLRASGAKWLHLDVMDGHFVPNITFGYALVKSLRPLTEGIRLDVHLMMTNPSAYIDKFADAGADAITVHTECGDDIDRCLAMINARGITAGVAIKPATPAEAVSPYIDRIGHVLIMTVEPGFGGQTIMYDCLDKAAKLRRIADEAGRTVTIAVDGGVNAENCRRVADAGIDVLVAGNAVFGAEDLEKAYRELAAKVR